jgi:hypothetical protein
MLSYTTKLVTGLIGTAIICTFIFGLAHSISTGFAGFWGGLPFWCIAVFVLSLAVWNFFDECVRKK